MAYVPPEYPGEIPEFAEVWPPVDDVNWMYTSAWDALVKEVRAIMTELGTDPAGASADIKTRLGLLALKANVLELDNEDAFTPDNDYEPATKKYVDDAAVAGFTDRGDPAITDWTQATLTADGAWHDLDLSAIVPAGAKAVLLSLLIWDSLVHQSMSFRKNGNINATIIAIGYTQVANITIAKDLVVACDLNRVIEYKGSNIAWDGIRLRIKGWWM